MNRRKLGLLVASAAVFVLSACGSSISSAGSAATVGPEAITNNSLTSQVDEVQTQKGEVAGGANAELVQAVLRRMVITDLLEQASAHMGVSVPDGQVAAAIDDAKTGMGGAEALAAGFLSNNVPASEIERQVRLSLTIDAMGKQMLPDGDGQSQSTAVFDYVVSFGKQIGVDISPRYGTWDADKLAIGPQPTDLSVPPAESLIPVPVQPTG